MIIKDENGVEKEVFTYEEVQQRMAEHAESEKAKALEEYKAANPNNTAELEETKTRLAEAEKELQDAITAGGGNADQVARLRQDRDEARREAKKAVDEVNKRLDEFQNRSVAETKTELLDRLSNGNKDLRDKIEYEFNNYKSTSNSKKDIEERMAVAVAIVTGNKPTPSLLDGVAGGMSSRGQANFKSNNSNNTFSETETALGSKMGITDADRARYLASKKN